MMVSRRKKRRNLRPKRFAKYETNTYRLVQLVSVGLAVDLFSLFLVIGHELYDLWNEYENSLSNEAIFVKEVDKLEMLIQAFEYERGQGKNLGDFFHTCTGSIRDANLVKILASLLSRRQRDGCEEEKKEQQCGRPE
jgi:5'-deoxynucleotidase YfbR-like HD superfamily hydrolase